MEGETISEKRCKSHFPRKCEEEISIIDKKHLLTQRWGINRYTGWIFISAAEDGFIFPKCDKNGNIASCVSASVIELLAATHGAS